MLRRKRHIKVELCVMSSESQIRMKIPRCRLDRLRQIIVLKCLPHVQHEYCSSFDQSDQWVLASRLPLPSYLLKLPLNSPTATALATRKENNDLIGSMRKNNRAARAAQNDQKNRYNDFCTFYTRRTCVIL